MALAYLTTPVDDLLADMSRRGLGRRGVFVVGAAVQMVPRTIERVGEIMDAQRARGMDTEGRIWRRARGVVPLAAPLVFGALAEVEERTMALESRAFTAPGRQTLLRVPPDRSIDRALRWLALAGCGGDRRSAADRQDGLTMAIELGSVRYRYAGSSSAALGPIDLRVEPGRVVGIVGANESGKTTLCLVAAGLAPGVIGGLLGGSVRIDGVDAATLRPHELAQRCGLLFQHAATQLSNTTATVFEEVAFGPCNLGLPVPEVVERVWWALRAVGIEALAPRDPARLSGGQGQLVALASVLALRPKYLVLDEPTSELDPAGTRLVAEALARIARETGAGILLVEHKTDVLAQHRGRGRGAGARGGGALGLGGGGPRRSATRGAGG